MLVVFIALALGCGPGRTPEPTAASALGPRGASDAVAPPTIPAGIDFTTQIRPILEERCQPCHFEGGKMHDELPFDSPETIDALGERLFTRIKDPESQEIIRSFLARNRTDGTGAVIQDP